jgi:ribonuclease HII
LDTTLIAGVDEAGCGPLAGPVIAAAVILDPNHPIDGLDDSKKLSPKRREELFPLIKKHCIAWAVGRAEAHEIDQINILQAALLAMHRAIVSLSIKPQQLLIDGLRCPHDLVDKYSMRAIIDGDSLIPEISAASIIAKVTRDHEMLKYDKQYPEYGFAKHKGYGTKIHLDAIKKHGICSIHRKSFAPCAAAK